MNDYIKRHNLKFLTIIFLISLVCTGMFYEYYSCAFGMLLSIIFLIKIKQQKQIIWKWNATTIFVTTMCLMYLVSCLWAVDAGMAFVGFLKFLPVFLFLIVIMQEKSSADNIMHALPYMVATLTLVTIGAMYIPALKSTFFVAGRLAGFFQYPNTYALLLLVAELLLIEKSNRKVADYVLFVILVAGILFTGSRTVFALAIVANIVLILAKPNKKVRLVGLIGILVLIVGIILYALLQDGANVLDRFLRFSVAESTFIGRILYFADALPTILKSPFGLGYMGYYYVQQSIQTGLYSVMYIHNDWLQILLDIGWIPCVLFFVAFIKTLTSKKVAFGRKVILTTMFLHSCFDFNLQFIAMYFLFLLFMDFESGKEIVVKKHLHAMAGVAVMIACICLYCGISLVLVRTGNYEAALKIYPWNTQAETYILTQLEDMDEAGTVADHILERNEYVTLAYSVKARQAYSKGDFGTLITYKNTLLEKALFQYDEVEEYCYMLINGISLYTKAGDASSAKVCQEELLAIPDRLRQAEERLSSLGKMIKDQPTTELPEDIQTYINRLEGAN